MPPIKATRTCREYMDKYSDSHINCPNCVKWGREIGRCRDEAGVVQRYNDLSGFENYKRMMETNTPVFHPYTQ